MNRITVLVGLILVAIAAIFLSSNEKPEVQEPPTLPSTTAVAEQAAPAPAVPDTGASLEVLALYPPGDQAPGNEIIVYFNEELAPYEPPEGTDAQALTTEPPVAGDVFIKDNYLRFRSENLSPYFDDPQNTHIDVVLHENLRSVTGQALSPESQRHSFAAPQPTISSVRLEDITEEGAELHLLFSRKAALEELPQLLSVTNTQGEALNAIIKPADNGREAIVILSLDVELPISISITQGLHWGDSNQYTAKAIVAFYPSDEVLQSPTATLVTGERPFIRLNFEQKVPLQWLRHLAIVKDVDTGKVIPFTLRAKEPQAITTYFPQLMLPATPEMIALKQVHLEISPWLRSSETDGTYHLSGRFMARVQQENPDLSQQDRRERKRPFELYYNYWESNVVDGLVLRLNFSHPVNPEELNSHIEIVPPVELVMAEDGDWSRSIRLKGDFKSEMKYTLRISAGLKDNEDNVLVKQDSSFSLQETPLQKGAAFDMTNLYYFPRKDRANPRVQARNTTEAKVHLAQIFPSNLPIFVREFSQFGANPHLITQYAQEIGEATVTFPNTPDTLLTREVALETLLPADGRGVFIMGVDPSYDYQDNSRLLIYTDLGALTHWTDEGLVVFVHNLFTLAPTGQAKVTVYSNKFQPIGATYTNAEGIARFLSFEAAFGAPALVIIEAENDYTFVDLLKPQETKTAFTASMPNYDADGYDAYIYLDRNLYRPGETIHIRWIVRTHYVDAVPNVPFQLRIANPKGSWIYEAPVTPSEFGTGSFSFKTEQTHPTGKYRVELRVPEAPLPTGETVFNLEEFVPNRMKAEATFDCDRLTAEQTTTIQVKAENLYGGPATGRKSEARIYLRPTVYESEAWPGYHFGNEDTLEDRLIQLGEAVTDENGLASFPYTFAPPAEATMPLEAIVGARVFEVGGRAVSDTATVTAFPFDVMLGIAATPKEDAEILEVQVAAIGNDDTAADLDSVQLTLEREEWNYHIRGFSHNRETRWEKEFRTVKTLDVPLSEGKGVVELPYPSYGQYRLRVHSPQTPMYSMLLFDRWWGRLNVASTSRPELINLSVDKEQYHAGDQLNLRIESPYDGNAFVVVQGEEIMDQRVIPVVAGEGRTTFVVPHNWFPNAWIEATVVRNTEQQEASQYPYSSFGMVNVPLDAPDRRVEVSLLNVPEEIRPSETYTLNISTADVTGAPIPAEVTVAAVDEGIHGILGYDNPDPYSWFQRSRQFKLQRAHYYENVFFDGEPSPIGGDMMRRLGIASQVGENWIRPVALWSGVVTTDEAGQAAITFDMPEFIGQLRLVAVAVTSRATGASAASMYVRRPYILRTGMPRFALPGDRFECTASAINTTDAPITAQLRWNASGTLSGTGEKQLDLAANGEASWRVPVTAGAAPGQGMIEWTMTFTDSTGAVLETLTESAPIPVGSPAAYQTETELITLAPGETRLIENTRFVNEPALHTTIKVAGTPLWRLYPGLRYLLRYPHGCVEQITSQAMPLYMLRNYAQLYKDLLPQEQVIDAEVVDTYIRYAIERLLLMQANDGGLSSWQGGSISYPYGSVYALHFLTLMRRDRSYEVYDGAFRALQQYAAEIMRAERRYSKYPHDYYLRVYACYVLALDGNLEAIEYIARFDHVAIPKSARYLLAAAKAMNSQNAGDWEAYIANAPTAEFDSPQYSGTLHTDIRSDAIKLIALLQMEAPPEKMQSLVDSLFNYFGERHYFSTQESSFVVTALGMYIERFHHHNPELIAAQIVAPDGEHVLSGNSLFESVVPGVLPRFEISNTGQLPLYINLEMSGLPLQPRTTPISEGLNIKRSYFHETGKPVDGNAFTQGEQYIVTLTINPKRDLENLLLVDMLPAGFEVANPRLEPDIQPSAENGEADNEDENTIFTPAHLEVRDDRIAIAVDKVKRNKEYAFRYLVRAVTPGSFQLPALHAECMYQPATRAATVPGEIVVE